MEKGSKTKKEGCRARPPFLDSIIGLHRYYCHSTSAVQERPDQNTFYAPSSGYSGYLGPPLASTDNSSHPKSHHTTASSPAASTSSPAIRSCAGCRAPAVTGLSLFGTDSKHNKRQGRHGALLRCALAWAALLLLLLLRLLRITTHPNTVVLVLRLEDNRPRVYRRPTAANGRRTRPCRREHPRRLRRLARPHSTSCRIDLPSTELASESATPIELVVCLLTTILLLLHPTGLDTMGPHLRQYARLWGPLPPRHGSGRELQPYIFFYRRIARKMGSQCAGAHRTWKQEGRNRRQNSRRVLAVAMKLG